MKSKPLKISLHIIGGLIFLSIPVLVSPDIFNIKQLFTIPPFLRDFTTYFIILLFFYLNYFVLIPKLYHNNKARLYFTIVLVFYLIAEILPRVLFHELHHHRHHGHEGMAGPRPAFVMWMDISRHFFLFLVAFFAALILKVNKKLKSAQQEKTNAELSYLKAQINPHFLFNTLNSIYSLAIQKSDETANAVVKLSGMMRYVLTESKNDFVMLDKELNYIRDYIELQKLRLDKSVVLKVNITGDSSNKQIAPLILIPFIENAFKHGVNPEQNSEIIIDIGVNESLVNLLVKNRKVTVDNSTETQTGLGIENTRKRLGLIYPGKHYLTIEDNPDIFSVSLSIKV